MAAPDSRHPDRYVRALVSARRRIVQFALGSAIAALAVGFTLPRAYTARVVLLPAAEPKYKPPDEVLALASSLGLNLPFGAANATDLYPVMFLSDRLLRPLLDETLLGKGDVTLRDHLAPPDRRSVEARSEDALRRLRSEVLRAHKDAESDLITLHVTTDSPELSAAIANALTGRLESYLVDSRQTKGGQRREFLTSRREALEAELAQAEQALADFRDANRRIDDSPTRLLARERLERDRTLRQELLLQIIQQEELAKLAEARDTPVARVLEEAEAPIRSSLPPRSLLLALGVGLGLLAPISGVILKTAAEDR